MNLKEFKLVKNKQRPDFCYAYEKKKDSRKYSTWKEEWQSCLCFERHKKLLTDNHMVTIRIRKDGEWHEIDADWLKTLVRQEFLGE